MEVGEKKIIQQLGKDANRAIHLLEKEKLSEGTRAGKEIWKLAFLGKSFNSKNERRISLIRRLLDFPASIRGNRSSAEHFAYVWHSLKAIGVPVIPTVVILSDDEILETNFRTIGAGIYGKDVWGKAKSEQSTDIYMADINLEDVRKRAIFLAEIASKNNILLSQDHSFDLIIQHDGEWDVMARDIKNTQILSADNSREEILTRNLEVANRFIDIHLKRNQELLK